jgi:hypothetical protein
MRIGFIKKPQSRLKTHSLARFRICAHVVGLMSKLRYGCKSNRRWAGSSLPVRRLPRRHESGNARLLKNRCDILRNCLAERRRCMGHNEFHQYYEQSVS